MFSIFSIYGDFEAQFRDFGVKENGHSDQF